MGVRFLHAADIHLGAPVRGLGDLAPEWEQRMWRAIPEAYGKVIDTALARAVDFVVLAGDMFDTSRPSYGDYLRFFDGLARLDAAGIPVYLVAGNHDPYTSWAHHIDRLPDSAHLLGIGAPEFALFDRGGRPACLIGGRSYYNQTWPDDQCIAAGITREAAVSALGVDAPFAVGIIHTGLDIDANKAPAAQELLLASGIDYWACGHLHLRYVKPSVEDPRIAFPGCIQGRDIKETGERGCFLVDLEEDAPPRLEFVPTSSVVFQQVEVDVGACQTLADLAHLVQARLFSENGKVHCDDMVVRVTLVGKTALHGFLVQPAVLLDLRKRINDAYPTFFCDTLVDRTVPVGDQSPGPFHAVMGEIASEERGRDAVLINYVQNELVKRGIAVPSALSRRVGAFNEAAETVAADLLAWSEE